MLTIKTPATSANVGPGFDCLGLALDLYNTFDVELSEKNILEGVEECYSNEDNLFLKAYRKGCAAIGVKDCVHVVFHTGIPVSRGLGSSASLICGGLMAASALHDNTLTPSSMFQIASRMEGHPDNVAPCLFGGLTASLTTDNGAFVTHRMELHPDWMFTVLIPDFEVSTEEARGILPDEYKRSVAAENSAHAIVMCEALRTGSLSLLKIGAKDMIHEPYRRTLIHGYDTIQMITEKDTGGVLLISGSGSTCLLISKQPLSERALDLIEGMPEVHWDVRSLSPAEAGTYILGE